MQVLRRLPRLRMSRNLAPTLVETVPLRTSAASYLANGQAIRDDGSPFVARSWAPSTPSSLIMTVTNQLLLPVANTVVL